MRNINNNTYLLLGYYGARNIGDELMLYCILNWFKLNNINAIVISEDPDETHLRFNVPSIYNVPMLFEWGWPASLLNGRVAEMVKAIKNHNGIFVGGGDLIRDDFGWKNFFYVIEKCLFALMFRKEINFINVGIGIPHNWFRKNILNCILKKAKLIVVRDQRSFEYCEKISCKNLHFQPDIVQMLPSLINKEECHNNNLDSENYFIINLRDAGNAYGLINFDEGAIEVFAGVLDELIQTKKWRCLFIPFQCAKDADDNNLHNKVYEKMTEKKMAQVLEWNSDVNELIQIFSKSQLIIGMRLHAIILGIGLSIPSVIIPYDIKSLELCKVHGIETVIGKDIVTSKNKILEIVNASFKKSYDNSIDVYQFWQNLKYIAKV